jgi:hypothetical protein
MASIEYVTKVNAKPLAASEVVPNSPLATKIASLVSGAFEVVGLNQSGKPDVANPSTKIIYLTKSSSATLTDPYTEWIYTGTDGEAAVASKWEVIGETSLDLSGYKTKQTAYTASGLGTLKTITALTQNANGEISATASDIQTASTSQKGVVQLTDSTSSSSTTTAATPKNVKAAYDLANGKYSKPSTGIPKSDLASAVQTSLGKADSSIQGVKLEGASSSLTPSSGVVTIPNAVATGETGETNGLMTAADKSKLDTLKEITVTSTSVSDGTTTFNKYTHPTSAGNKHVPSGGSSGQVLVYGNSSGTASWGAVPGLSNKADKVSSATNGNFAGLDANGNLTDSGKKASDFATSAQGTKADSAVQDVKVNGTSVVNSSKVASIPVATASVYGVVTVETQTI